MSVFWPRRDYLTWTNEYAVVTYDPPGHYHGSSINLPMPGITSCIWLVPGTER